MSTKRTKQPDPVEDDCGVWISAKKKSMGQPTIVKDLSRMVRLQTRRLTNPMAHLEFLPGHVEVKATKQTKLGAFFKSKADLPTEGSSKKNKTKESSKRGHCQARQARQQTLSKAFACQQDKSGTLPKAVVHAQMESSKLKDNETCHTHSKGIINGCSVKTRGRNSPDKENSNDNEDSDKGSLSAEVNADFGHPPDRESYFVLDIKKPKTTYNDDIRYSALRHSPTDTDSNNFHPSKRRRKSSKNSSSNDSEICVLSSDDSASPKETTLEELDPNVFGSPETSFIKETTSKPVKRNYCQVANDSKEPVTSSFNHSTSLFTRTVIGELKLDDDADDDDGDDDESPCDIRAQTSEINLFENDLQEIHRAYTTKSEQKNLIASSTEAGKSGDENSDSNEPMTFHMDTTIRKESYAENSSTKLSNGTDQTQYTFHDYSEPTQYTFPSHTKCTSHNHADNTPYTFHNATNDTPYTFHNATDDTPYTFHDPGSSSPESLHQNDSQCELSDTDSPLTFH